jgi:hypothetical protein
MHQPLERGLPLLLGPREVIVLVTVVPLVPDLPDRLVHEVLEVVPQGHEPHGGRRFIPLGVEGHDDLRVRPDLGAHGEGINPVLHEVQVGDPGVRPLDQVPDHGHHLVGGDMTGDGRDGVLHREDHADQRSLEVLVLLRDVGHREEDIGAGDARPAGDVHELDLEVTRDRDEQRTVVDPGFYPLRVERFRDLLIEPHGRYLLGTDPGEVPGMKVVDQAPSYNGFRPGVPAAHPVPQEAT